MLVLRRKLHEDIIIGDDITVRIVEIGREFVRLGITAPRDIEIDRSEVRDRKVNNAIANQDKADKRSAS